MIETSFPPLARPDARILVLGSMPGRRSLDEARYYAHPRNLFWPFMARVAGFDPGLGYEARVQALLCAGVALWDVLAACERPGSLDTAIRRASERPNAIGELLHAHPGITLVACNGGKALQLFQRHVRPTPSRHASKSSGCHRPAPRTPRFPWPSASAHGCGSRPTCAEDVDQAGSTSMTSTGSPSCTRPPPRAISRTPKSTPLAERR